MALSFIMVIFSISIFNLNMLSNVTWVYSMDWSRHHRMHHRWVIVWCNNDRGYGGNRWLWGNNDRGRHNRGRNHMMDRLLNMVHRGRYNMMNRLFNMVDRSNMMIGWRMMLIRTSCDRNNSDRSHMAAHMDARSRVVTMMYRLFHNNVLITKHLRNE